MAHFAKLEIDVKINAPAAKFYEIFHSKPYIISNISPNIIKSCELLKGEWGKVSSIICWNYVLDGKVLVAKELIESVDEENNLITFKVIEGDILIEYKSFKITIQGIQNDKEIVVRWTFLYQTFGSETPDSRSLFKMLVELSKDIDAYLTQDKQGPYVDVAATAQA